MHDSFDAKPFFDNQYYNSYYSYYFNMSMHKENYKSCYHDLMQIFDPSVNRRISTADVPGLGVGALDLFNAI